MKAHVLLCKGNSDCLKVKKNGRERERERERGGGAERERKRERERGGTERERERESEGTSLVRNFYFNSSKLSKCSN